MKKRKLFLLVMIACICAIAFGSNTKTSQASDSIKIEQTAADIQVIPDKYNTGCTGELSVVEMDAEDGTIVNDVLFIAGSDATRHVLDFYYRNKDISGDVIIENFDFSEFPLWCYNADKVERDIKVVFNNCKFSSVSVGRTVGKVSFEFNNCSFRSFNGGNSIFNSCQFGKSYSDGMVPFQNVHVKNCFFTDMGSMAASDKEIHTDGIQIYGYKDVDVQDVSYTNCRFEIPPLRPEGSTAYINACIMLQLEFANAKDVLFKDCIVNGGGYSIYAVSKYEGLTFENVAFQGIRFGAAKKYGVFYTKVDPTISIKDVSGTDSLYIGSVWKEDGETHLSITNDTNQERTLLIYTDQNEYTYSIPACPLGNEMAADMVYTEMPFDMDITIPEDCQYVVCYDSTIDGYGKQIRFMNWSEEDVYLETSLINDLTSHGDDILLEGSCGKTVNFTLTKAGVLTLSGTGSTESYHSAKFPAWAEYTDYIQEIRVEEGIEGLGGMIFRNCTNVKVVSLPESLLTIGQRVFGGCVSLTDFTLPAGITELGRAVFSGTVLQEIYYTGTNWDSVTLAADNENLAQKVVYYHNGQVLYRINYVLNATETEAVTNENPRTYTAGSEILLQAPIRNGYTFEGWYFDEGFTKKVDGITKTDSGNKIVYAKWSPASANTVQNNTINNSTNNTANNSTNNTNNSDSINDNVTGSKAAVPKKVKGLKVKKRSKTSLKIRWKRNKKVIGYQIAMKTSGKGKYKIVKTINKNKMTRFVKKKLKKGKIYFIKVRAYVNVDGKKIYGAYSGAKKVRLK